MRFFPRLFLLSSLPPLPTLDFDFALAFVLAFDLDFHFAFVFEDSLCQGAEDQDPSSRHPSGIADSEGRQDIDIGAFFNIHI